jgi:hypothetical protein
MCKCVGIFSRMKPFQVERMAIRGNCAIDVLCHLLFIQLCQLCCRDDNEAQLLLCDMCDRGYHTYCIKVSILLQWSIVFEGTYCSCTKFGQFRNSGVVNHISCQIA